MKKFQSESLIIAFCRAYRFPLNVKSTVMQLHRFIQKEIALDEVHMVYLALFLGIKIEEIQDSMLDKLEIFFVSKMNRKELFEKEVLLAGKLDYNFVFENVYVKAYGLMVRLSESNLIEIKTGDFETVEKMIDKALCTNYSSIQDVVLFGVAKYYKLNWEKMCDEYGGVLDNLNAIDTEYNTINLLSKEECLMPETPEK
ncbi:hypothetical protein ECANGB1_67 [Enterospora canceri]|uniref:Uncharacterized protein n=1 Tax=Enterospora canceri TaxID=1081671 RepID=A0A1Y1S8G7_9MICR|nr:hypothetical protein ECANGB1_67 [Enterospora canceri]